jgi:hypothetical protein
MIPSASASGGGGDELTVPIGTLAVVALSCRWQPPWM